MRLTELALEAWASARAQKVPTVLVALIVAATCATTLLTVGRAAAAETEVAATLESAGSRHLVITDAKTQGFLSATVVAQAVTLSGVERAVGLTAAVDAVNARIGDGGERVPTWLLVGDVPSAAELVSGRWPHPGEALVSASARRLLGLDEPVGAVATIGSRGRAIYPIVGEFRAKSPYADIADGVLVAAPSNTTAWRLDVVTTTAAEIPETQDALLTLLHRMDPSDVEIESPQELAAVQADVLGNLARYNRSLALLVLGAGAVLTAIVTLADVLLHRAEIGRRRALGAARWVIIVLLVLRAAIGAVLGVVFGAIAATLLVARLGQRPDWRFTAATAVLSLLAGALATMVPAVGASRQDPVRVLRIP